jgi:hypothetical protein
MLLLEPPRFGFITQPTKRCLLLRFIGEASAIIDGVAKFCRTAALELSAPRRFHFRFGHGPSLMPYETNLR